VFRVKVTKQVERNNPDDEIENDENNKKKDAFMTRIAPLIFL
jgi:hypothetical protein